MKKKESKTVVFNVADVYILKILWMWTMAFFFFSVEHNFPKVFWCEDIQYWQHLHEPKASLVNALCVDEHWPYNVGYLHCDSIEVI